jgi:hypothetical protein
MINPKKLTAIILMLVIFLGMFYLLKVSLDYEGYHQSLIKEE